MVVFRLTKKHRREINTGLNKEKCVSNKITVAIVQASPVFSNLGASLTRAVAFVEEAAKTGARLVAFGETCCPAIRRISIIARKPLCGITSRPKKCSRGFAKTVLRCRAARPKF